MLSRLDAVNAMLEAIGEDPVNSLTSGNPDAEAAVRKLDAVKTKILADGWHCNTRESITLTANASGVITAPGNCLSIDTVGWSRRYDVILKGTTLFNRGEDTATFPVGLRLQVDYTLDLEWDDLTYTLKQYIAARAAREFQAGAISSTTLDSFVSRDEIDALFKAKAEDMNTRDINMLRDNPNSGPSRWTLRR